MWLRRISLTARISGLMLIVLAAFIAMGFASINSVRDNIYDERKRSISSVVDSALSIVGGFYRRYQDGEMSEREAQRQAKEVLRSLRFEGENYVWINDMNSNMVMHPTNPELEGTNVSAMEDVAGLRVFPEFVRTVRTQGSGYVEYLWPVEGQDEPEGKISYVKPFERWGWVLGTGVWVQDLEQSVNAALVTILIQVSVFALAIGVIGYLLVLSISYPIRTMARAGNAIVKDGNIDLRQRFNEDGNDELTRLSRAMNTVFEKIEETLHQVITSQSIVTNTTSVVSNTVNQTNQSLSNQQHQVDTLTRAMQEMRSTVDAVSHNTETAVQLSSEASDEANAGSVVVKNTVAEIKQLYDTMQATKASMETLADDVVSIDSVLDVINSIAEQTNLLALNAAIEAARAGEQGRGFAVVADEVRGLAQRTQQSTQEIQKIIERLQNGANDAVNHMSASAEKAEAATEFSTNAGQAFDKIRLRISDIDTNTSLIADAAKGQASTSQQIDAAVSAIRDAMAPVRDSMNQTEESAGQLIRAVDEVQGAVRNIVLRS